MDRERWHESTRVLVHARDSLHLLHTSSSNSQKLTFDQPLCDQSVQTLPSQYKSHSPPPPAPGKLGRTPVLFSTLAIRLRGHSRLGSQLIQNGMMKKLGFASIGNNLRLNGGLILYGMMK